MNHVIRRVSVIGLGVIGESIAHRMLDQGFDVTVFNRSPEKAVRLRHRGAHLAASPADAVQASEVTIVSVTNDDAVLAVATGSRGLVDGATPNAFVVDCSTVAPATDLRVAQALNAKGVRYLDAPVTGGAEAAQRGSLTLLCGGAAEDLRRVTPVLNAIGTRIFHMGPIGSGQATKMINQVILAGSLLGVAEGMTLASAFRLDPDVVIEALKEGAAASWALSNRATFMARRDFPPLGRLALHLKDLNIALANAATLGVELPGARLVRDLEQRLESSGRGDLDISALILAVAPTSRDDAPSKRSFDEAR